MKKIVNMFMICLTILLCGIIVGCNDDNDANMGVALHDSQGLEYYPLEDGSYAVSLGNAQFLKNLVFPEKFNGKPVTTIIGRPVAGLGNIKIMIETVTLPNTITTIGTLAFNAFENLKEITIPDSVTTIEYGAFNNCANLSKVILPKDLNEIKESTFYNCKSLQEISIPDNVTSIGNFAFQSCSNLNNIQLPKNLESIGQGAFGYCSKLTSVTIPSCVTNIDDSSFRNCTNINIVLSVSNQVNFHQNSFYTGQNSLESSFYSIYYLGNQEQWNTLISSCDFGYSEVIFYSDTYQEGNYWHYDTDGVTPIKWSQTA